MLWSLLGALPLVRGVLPTCASLTVVSHIRERLSGRFGRVDGGYGGVKVGIRGEVWAGARGPRGLERGARRVGRGRAVCPPSPGSVPLRGCRVRPSGPSAAVTSPESGFLCVPWVRLRCRLVTPAAGGRGSLPAGEQSPLRPHPHPHPPPPGAPVPAPPTLSRCPCFSAIGPPLAWSVPESLAVSLRDASPAPLCLHGPHLATRPWAHPQGLCSWPCVSMGTEAFLWNVHSRDIKIIPRL